MAGDQEITRRSDEYRLSDPTENVVLWQRSNLLSEGLMSINLATQLKMFYYGRGAACFLKV